MERHDNDSSPGHESQSFYWEEARGLLSGTRKPPFRKLRYLLFIFWLALLAALFLRA